MKTFNRVSKIILLMTVALLAGTKAGASTNDVNFAQLDKKLRAMITDVHTSDSNLLDAISHLGRITEPRDFWTRIANDTNYTAMHRARAVCALFRRHLAGEIDLYAVGDDLRPSDWLKDSWVDKLDPHFFNSPGAGFHFKVVNESDSIFKVDILKTDSNIYFRFNHDVDLKTFMTLLKNQGDSTNQIIAEMVLEDDYKGWYQGGPLLPPIF